MLTRGSLQLSTKDWIFFTEEHLEKACFSSLKVPRNISRDPFLEA